MGKVVNLSELRAIFMNLTVMPRTQLDADGYGLEYQCGCGMTHPLQNYYVTLCAKPVRFVVTCPNQEIKNMISVKGIFTQSCENEWWCETKLYDDLLKEAGG
tara:strand:- start:388 stop:693 length:306 start_codon:yes stop_codon:yes gene_type:complete